MRLPDGALLERLALSPKQHSSTVAIVPPEALWPPIQRARRALRDKGLYRWPPHINLLYPFLPTDDFAAAAVGTMGVALRSCTLPGQPRQERIADGMMEVGLGIHGEPGAMVAPLAKVDDIVDQLLGFITSQEKGRGYLTLAKGDTVHG